MAVTLLTRVHYRRYFRCSCASVPGEGTPLVSPRVSCGRAGSVVARWSPSGRALVPRGFVARGLVLLLSRLGSPLAAGLRPESSSGAAWRVGSLCVDEKSERKSILCSHTNGSARDLVSLPVSSLEVFFIAFYLESEKKEISKGLIITFENDEIWILRLCSKEEKRMTSLIIIVSPDRHPVRNLWHGIWLSMRGKEREDNKENANIHSWTIGVKNINGRKKWKKWCKKGYGEQIARGIPREKNKRRRESDQKYL